MYVNRCRYELTAVKIKVCFGKQREREREMGVGVLIVVLH